MNEGKGLVFDIQSYSVHDGPGCRTTVFLMGCPLRCAWCANPEGWEFRQRMLYRSRTCTHETSGCVRCIKRCPFQAISAGSGGKETLVIDRDKCKTCETFECTEACLREAMVVCGKWHGIPDLMKILNRDRQYWGNSGGVTFSGGDALGQIDFLTAMLKCCQESYIHTVIETSACFAEEPFLAAMNAVDFAFVDIKHMDSEKHRDQTGASNSQVLTNLAALAAVPWKGRLVIRIPVIPGFNEDDENMVATAKFARNLGY